MLFARSLAPSGTLSARVTRAPRGTTVWAAFVAGLPLPGLPAEVFRYRVRNLPNLLRGTWKLLLAQALKALPITLVAARPIDEAISTAGGVRLQALDANGMCVAAPGVFCAGEMLDWEAPTGGYLLTACMASGVHAAQGVARYLKVDGETR